MHSKKPLILVSNDDGITSLGIKTLIELMQELGEVVVVAPDSPQSGMGHAITIGEPLRLHAVEIFEDVKAYECSGTPADCVNFNEFIQRNLKLYELNNDVSLNTAAAANFIRGEVNVSPLIYLKSCNSDF